MSILVTGMGTAVQNAAFETQLNRLQALPAFRKATRNMMLAYAAVEEALAATGQATTDFATCALVFGSSYGEIETTFDFLRHLALEGIARPILFQNSLHNATPGFLTLALGIQGPSFTVSHHHLGAEKALELACDLLHSGAVTQAIVCTAEVLSGTLIERLTSDVHEQSPARASAVTLAVAEFVQQRHLKPLAELVYCKVVEAVTPEIQRRTQPDGLSTLATAVRGLSVPEQRLELRKPDGSMAQVLLRRP